ncbi:hypothetical protein BU25DRAFT_404636 [Macroventuria anomochaeta]|uniref:Uncharacterized protein n=1 Tax=Macroventuria anomochaeta TaxID=301207 RepID=A0ACB6RHV2_9PLEO|nr:uncharacterized protein BU25DRAFT_404636 [Macroventuria anomochaeta]KAF2621272.1 hypothetical protein BU25DRAFT_404636 [Macroventuria anomochaeta]
MDSNRHNADLYTKYKLYFNLLQSKISQYDVDAEHTYNMDEKGFMIGVTTRTKHVFSRRMWEKKEVTATTQDGNRAWVTLVACVCGDGLALPLGCYDPTSHNRTTSNKSANQTRRPGGRRSRTRPPGRRLGDCSQPS